MKFTIESLIIEVGALIGMEKNLSLISIIIPVYNEENTVEEIVSRVKSSLKEYKISLDGKTFPLPIPFIVVATQNPIEYQGTYPLPEAQIDRFLMKI